jgi:hypothetical protein
VRYSDTRLEHIVSWRAAADLDTDTTLQMFDVKLGGLTSAIGGSPSGAIGKDAPTVWGNLSHLADSLLAFHNQINKTVTEKVKFFITQSDLSPYVAVGGHTQLESVPFNNRSISRKRRPPRCSKL